MLLMQVTFCIYLYSLAHVFGVNNSLKKIGQCGRHPIYPVVGAMLDPVEKTHIWGGDSPLRVNELKYSVKNPRPDQ